MRCDSGDPLDFVDKAVNFYRENRIDPASKTVVFSDSLNIDNVRQIKQHVAGRVHDTYGIGTCLTNDVGATPLNMVIKLTHVKSAPDAKNYFAAVKLSDFTSKNTGDENEIEICKLTLGLAK